MKRVLVVILITVQLSCSSKINFHRELAGAEKKFKDNTGFMLYDPETHKTIAEFNASRYFAPASNTKILTFYTALHVLGDSIPALKYSERNDSLIFWGAGDPSFLYPAVYNNGRTFRFLQNNPHRLFFSTSNFTAEAWGPGWAWDDLPFSWSAERTPFPVYGNVEHVTSQNAHIKVTPVLFQSHFLKGDSIHGNTKLVREMDSNEVTYFPGTNQSLQEWYLPFHYSSDMLAELLSDTLKRQVDELNAAKPIGTETLFSIPSDTLYSVMMKFSDNLIAEQLLLQCGEKLSDSLDTGAAIRFAKENLLADLPDSVVWVDGSGLSRYNLTTPRNIVKIWEKLYREFPKERLFPLLAAGGQKGTLKYYYVASPPFIFGKTGSLSNNHSLSGFLVTKKKKVFIFSFMNGDFVAPAKNIKAMMQDLLTRIRNNY